MTYTLRTPEVIVYADPQGAFTVSKHLELIDGEWRTYIHTEFHRFSPSILKEVDRIFPIERGKLPPIIGALARKPSKVFEHYVRRYGFVPTTSIMFDDGLERVLWVHIRDDLRLNNQK